MKRLISPTTNARTAAMSVSRAPVRIAAAMDVTTDTKKTRCCLTLAMYLSVTCAEAKDIFVGAQGAAGT